MVAGIKDANPASKVKGITITRGNCITRPKGVQDGIGEEFAGKFGGFVPPFPWPLVRSMNVVILGFVVMVVGAIQTRYEDDGIYIVKTINTDSPYPVFNKPTAITAVTHVIFYLAIAIAVFVTMCLAMHSVVLWGMFLVEHKDMSMSQTLDELGEKLPISKDTAGALIAKMQDTLNDKVRWVGADPGREPA